MSGADLRVLIVEDNANDAELMVGALCDAGLAAQARRVETREDYEHALGEFNPDVILTDLALPRFDGLGAIRVARGRGVHVPIVIVTGTAPDASAVELLKLGASDYVLKDRLARLGPAVRAALAAAHTATATQQLAADLRQSEVRYRRLFETAHDGILILDAKTGLIEDLNPFLQQLLGHDKKDLVGRALWDAPLFREPEQARRMFDELRRERRLRFESLPLQARDGARVDVEFVCNVYEEEGGREVAQCNIRDIRERVQQQRRLAEQLDELQRFETASVDRERRVEELKAEARRLRGLVKAPGGSGP